jgi:hypothetical protein
VAKSGEKFAEKNLSLGRIALQGTLREEPGKFSDRDRKVQDFIRRYPAQDFLAAAVQYLGLDRVRGLVEMEFQGHSQSLREFFHRSDKAFERLAVELRLLGLFGLIALQSGRLDARSRRLEILAPDSPVVFKIGVYVHVDLPRLFSEFIIGRSVFFLMFAGEKMAHMPGKAGPDKEKMVPLWGENGPSKTGFFE